MVVLSNLLAGKLPRITWKLVAGCHGLFFRDLCGNHDLTTIWIRLNKIMELSWHQSHEVHCQYHEVMSHITICAAYPRQIVEHPLFLPILANHQPCATIDHKLSLSTWRKPHIHLQERSSFLSPSDRSSTRGEWRFQSANLVCPADLVPAAAKWVCPHPLQQAM